MSGFNGLPALSMRGVLKRFGEREVLKGLDLTIEQGECVALLGPNGAGKSTTVGIALGLTAPSAGDVQLMGVTVLDSPESARRRVGVVPQYDALDPDFTVQENLQVFGRYFGLKADELSGRVDALLDFARLKDRRHDHVNTLSGGMRRRLQLARALINAPGMLFLDEPCTGLDPAARHAIWEGLQALKLEGMAILLTTHDMDEAKRLADRVAVLDGGRIAALDTPEQLINTHAGHTVLEVWGAGAQTYLKGRLHIDDADLEWRGQTAFVRNDMANRCLERIRLDRPEHVDCLYRPGNLEDVFFRLTGRTLEGSGVQEVSA